MKLELSFRKFFSSFVLFGLTFGLSAQTVNIPDSNFKNALLNHSPVIDVNSDGEIQVSEAQAVTVMDVSGKSIQDLTGIAAFVNIMDLNCSNNQLTNLDLSQNTLLEVLSCSTNQLTNLNVTQNIELRDLIVSNNQLTSLDVTQNIELNYLNCISNLLTSLDITQNTSLNGIDCADNQLTALDISNNVNLQVFTCAHNYITSLDFTQNPQLASFAGQNNELTFLDLRNGNNTVLQFIDTQDNPNLKCIFVDDATYSQNQTIWFKDPASTYVETQAECDALGTKESAIKQLLVFPNPVRTRFYVKGTNLQPKKVRVYDVLGNKVKTFPTSTSSYDISGLQKGLYFVEISTNQRSWVRKIIKE